MSKSKATAQDFLSRMTLGGQEPAEIAAPTKEPAPARAKGTARAGLKHIGGYFDREMVEKVAVLRARLDLDNSQLIQRAIEELYGREVAARKFGDR